MVQRSLLYRKRTITIVKKWSLATVSDAGERNRSNAKIGSYVMLRHSLDDIWIFLQQFFVPLLWCILDTGQEQVLVEAEPLYNFSLHIAFLMKN